MQHCLAVEGGGVGGLGEAGRGVDVDVHLLGQLQHRDVVVEAPAGGGVALVVVDLGHGDRLLGDGRLARDGEVVVAEPHLHVRGGERLLAVLVEEHAVGGRHHVLGGHQGGAAELAAVGREQSGHPGVFVFLADRVLDIYTSAERRYLDTYGVDLSASNNS